MYLRSHITVNHHGIHRTFKSGAIQRQGYACWQLQRYPARRCIFKAHPEFNGDVRLTVPVNGQVLLSAKNTVDRPAVDNDADPIMLGFLQFLEKQMADHPDLIEPVDRDQLNRIGKLVEGVSADDSTH
jgi:hypothetical protein